MSIAPRLYLLAPLLLLAGCHRNFFAARGQFGTDGPAFGHWASAPQGCSRDPKDALSDAETRTVATFFWQDPAYTHPELRNYHFPPVPDAADQVNLLRAEGGGYNVRLKTLETSGRLIKPSDCSRFAIKTHEQGPAFPGGRSSLAGSVALECNVKQSRVFADFTFERCEY